MKHETKTDYVTQPRGESARFGACSCGWMGPMRQTELSAKVDGKRHRLATLADDDGFNSHSRYRQRAR